MLPHISVETQLKPFNFKIDTNRPRGAHLAGEKRMICIIVLVKWYKTLSVDVQNQAIAKLGEISAKSISRVYFK